MAASSRRRVVASSRRCVRAINRLGSLRHCLTGLPGADVAQTGEK
jgi:hypothetical protein